MFPNLVPEMVVYVVRRRRQQPLRLVHREAIALEDAAVLGQVPPGQQQEQRYGSNKDCCNVHFLRAMYDIRMSNNISADFFLFSMEG